MDSLVLKESSETKRGDIENGMIMIMTLFWGFWPSFFLALCDGGLIDRLFWPHVFFFLGLID